MKGSSEAKKSKGALAVIAFGGVPKKSAPEDSSDVDVDPHTASFTSFADAAGIEESARPRAMAALKQYIRACISSETEDDSEEY